MEGIDDPPCPFRQGWFLSRRVVRIERVLVVVHQPVLLRVRDEPDRVSSVTLRSQFDSEEGSGRRRSRRFGIEFDPFRVEVVSGIDEVDQMMRTRFPTTRTHRGQGRRDVLLQLGRVRRRDKGRSKVVQGDEG